MLRKILIAALIGGCDGATVPPPDAEDRCTLDLDALCGARPDTDPFYDALSRIGTAEFTEADAEAVRFYGDRLTAWSSCAAVLATEGR